MPVLPEDFTENVNKQDIVGGRPKLLNKDEKKNASRKYQVMAKRKTFITLQHKMNTGPGLHINLKTV